jgi:hypothetical protein
MNMSTRCTVKVEGVNYAKVYKHFDGYPSATLKWLEDFNKDFTENRGNDPEYKFAQLLRSSSRDAEKYGLDDSDYTGWGVMKYADDWNEEYEYTLHKDGTTTYTYIYED